MNTQSFNKISGLAIYLCQDDLLTLDEARIAIESARAQNTTLVNFLVKSGMLSSHSILECCIRHFSLPYYDLKNYDTAYLKHTVIKPEIMLRYRVIPLRRMDPNILQLGITDPTDHTTVTTIEFHTGLHIQPVLVSELALEKIIHTHCQDHILHAQVESALLQIDQEEQKPNTLVVEDHDNDEPVVELVNQIITDAINKKASDIHIEPFQQHCRIRFRCDGLLYEVTTLPLTLATRMITRLKIMAELNIAERRLPQDGRIQLDQDTKKDIRLNTCPVLCGEKVVLRILDSLGMSYDISSLGLTDIQQEIFLNKLNEPQGLILVTGPTGSGKTITLYSALQHLNQIVKNIITIEDPVEMELFGINQLNVNNKIGLSFATALKTFLRQDPDIIMVGEIRDVDTANMAIQAAQTGHLVLSTLHTNHAADTITRLRSMHIAAYQLMSGLSLIIAQRLIRKLCSDCKPPTVFVSPDALQHEYHESISLGCQACHDGYQGRMGIFELIPITDNIKQAIFLDHHSTQIANIAKGEGHLSLWQSGMEQVKEGKTDLKELRRVLGSI